LTSNDDVLILGGYIYIWQAQHLCGHVVCELHQQFSESASLTTRAYRTAKDDADPFKWESQWTVTATNQSCPFFL
jgi:hypothetical protein